MRKIYKAMVLSCIDPRFQPKVYKYLKKKKFIGDYSSFTIAGGAIGVTATKFKKWHIAFWQNLETSIKLHKIKTLIVLNHQDCGAAKMVNGGKPFNPKVEKKIHEKSFILIKRRLKKKFPKINIRTKILSLN